MDCLWKITHSYTKSMFLKGNLGFWDTIQPVRCANSSHKCLIWKCTHSLNTLFFQEYCASRIQLCVVFGVELEGTWSLTNVMRSGMAFQLLRITCFLSNSWLMQPWSQSFKLVSIQLMYFLWLVIFLIPWVLCVCVGFCIVSIGRMLLPNYSAIWVVRDLALEMDGGGLCPFRFRKVKNMALHWRILCLPSCYPNVHYLEIT